MSLLADLLHGGWIRAVDHALAQSLRRARPDTPDAVLVAAALASRALADGHARLPLAHAAELLEPTEDGLAPPALPDHGEWRATLAASPWVHAIATDGGREPAPADRVLVLEADAIALRRYRELEARLATALLARAHAADTPRLQLLTGGPGTGKTTRVAGVLAAAALARDANDPPLRIALAAPTGKAAARLAEAVREAIAAQVADGSLPEALAATLPATATTVHRLLGWQRDGTWRHGAAQPLAMDLVVVDEASMIDLPLMAALIEAVPAEATLVLVGDPDQLPSVEAGAVLAALCTASAVPGAPLAAHREHLVRAHRQAADFDAPVLAAAVRAGDADAALDALRGGRLRGVHWRRDGDRALAAAILAEVVPAYRALALAPDAAAALQAARGLRVLCALHEGAAGTIALNAAIGLALDPWHRGAGWFQGRLLLVTANSPRQGLANGDVGVAWPDAQGEPRVWFEGEDGPRAWLPAALPAHEPAWALTVHKAQGSEFERVWLALPERGARVLSRELLYTGITRARRQLHLWASETALRQAIDRPAERWSGLAVRLQPG